MIQVFRDLGVSEERVVTIRNWLPEHVEVAYKKTHLQSELTFCFVGWLVVEKGILELLAAVESLVNNGYQLKVKVIGDGNLMEDCKSFVRHCDLGVCRIFGWLDYRRVAEELLTSDVFILPTHAEGAFRTVYSKRWHAVYPQYQLTLAGFLVA